ncbi:transporter [Clostridium polyendosporum]|uniref:Transporter n=1 Tax=Clostridium polyendosporum TaxID=69208 RepID=A0A919VGP4_9CLOT|nr:hypothetical protein [Clostridium polyendosporum]GIM28846.1 transporter [Clostridium polyendosporum]
MVMLSLIHYVYIIITVIILATLALRKNLYLPCILGILIIAFMYSGNAVKAIQIMYNSFITATTEFLGIIMVIALVMAMSKALSDIGADKAMIRPLKKVIRGPISAFFILGFVMLFIGWFIWPAPGVALIGTLLLPAALEAGLSAVWAASAMNLFGHGIALSSDFFIQGAPAITAKAAGVSTYTMMKESIPLWLVMSFVTIGVASVPLFKQYAKKNSKNKEYVKSEVAVTKDIPVGEDECSVASKIIAVLVPLVFIIDIIIMIKYKIVGSDASALVGGTATIIMCIIALIPRKSKPYNLTKSMQKIGDFFGHGLMFGIEVFAPVIVIAAFFFLGGEGTAKAILGPNATGFLNDIGIALSHAVPMGKFPIIVIVAAAGALCALDGSGFSALPLVGSLAQAFAPSIDVNPAALATIGQMTAIFVGGGTIIPWGVLPIPGVCGIAPEELCKHDLIPVLSGFVAIIIVGTIIL